MNSVNKNNKLKLIFFCTLITGSQTLYAQDGESLFRENCARCHQAGPQSFSAPANKLEQILKSGSIRPHRFSLSVENIKLITDYINQKK